MSLWGAFRTRLAQDFRVISYDHRGCGGSTGARWMTTAELADDSLKILDHLQVPRAHVFGLSLGGMVATWLAIRAPARVERLCLACAPSQGIELLHGHLRREARLLGSVFSPTKDLGASVVLRVLSRPFRRTHPEAVRRLDHLLHHEPSSRLALLLHGLAAFRHDARSELGSITARTLVLAGEDDDLLGVDAPRRLAAAIRGATFDVVASSGHAITVEQPAATAACVARFFAASGS